MRNRFIEVSSTLLAQGYGVRFRASGESMQPAICAGDSVTIGPLASERLAPGAVVAYRHRDRLFVHRVVSVGTDVVGGRPRVLLRGDALDACDAPISPDQVVGEVLEVRRLSETRSLVRMARMLLRVLRSCRRPGVPELSAQRAI
jgi:hypothetical protein